jgi:hypothetical protein
MVHVQADRSDTATLHKRLPFTAPISGMYTIHVQRFDGTTGMQGLSQRPHQRL